MFFKSNQNFTSKDIELYKQLITAFELFVANGCFLRLPEISLTSKTDKIGELK